MALGEIGLDYHYDFSPRPIQQEVFRRQLELAAKPGSCRSSSIPGKPPTTRSGSLRDHGARLRVVFHCFTGGLEMARAALDLGAWLSFAGIVTFPKAAELREVARMVPPDRFLVETDSPYLAPVPFRGKRNEPAFVAKVVEGLAAVRGAAAEEIAATVDGELPRCGRPRGFQRQ